MSIKYPEAFNEIWPYAIGKAKAMLQDGYLSATGIPKTKLNRVKMQEDIELDVAANVIWRLSGDTYTPHYWRMKLVDEAKSTPSHTPRKHPSPS